MGYPALVNVSQASLREEKLWVASGKIRDEVFTAFSYCQALCPQLTPLKSFFKVTFDTAKRTEDILTVKDERSWYIAKLILLR